jgi:hypothetical protein
MGGGQPRRWHSVPIHRTAWRNPGGDRGAGPNDAGVLIWVNAGRDDVAVDHQLLHMGARIGLLNRPKEQTWEVLP